MSLEESMIYGPESPIPVYFSHWNPELEVILEDVQDGFITDEKAASAAEALFNSISASGYQVVVSSSQAVPKTDVKVATLHGKLTGTGAEDRLPTIALVAHYDSLGAASVRQLFHIDFHQLHIVAISNDENNFYRNCHLEQRVTRLDWQCSSSSPGYFQCSIRWVGRGRDIILFSLWPELVNWTTKVARNGWKNS